MIWQSNINSELPMPLTIFSVGSCNSNGNASLNQSLNDICFCVPDPIRVEHFHSTLSISWKLYIATVSDTPLNRIEQVNLCLLCTLNSKRGSLVNLVVWNGNPIVTAPLIVQTSLFNDMLGYTVTMYVSPVPLSQLINRRRGKPAKMKKNNIRWLRENVRSTRAYVHTASHIKLRQ